MEKFQNKYRIPSARWQGYDYGQNGAYFITICTANRVHFFGEIVKKAIEDPSEMQLNALGQLAETIWMEIPQQFPFIELGAFVVMPNHIHGVLIVNKMDGGDVETRLIASLPPGGITGDKNPMLHDNLSRVVRWYKGRCTFEMRKLLVDFAWQSRFHDHVIRNNQSFDNISHYIINNPKNWDKDKFHGQ